MSARVPTASLGALALTLTLTVCAPPVDPPGPRVYETDLAEDIPATGVPSEHFSRVDTAVRQFMKWRCAGAGTLAIAYKGRRVHKRGFGRMHGRASSVLYEGCGSEESNPFDPESPLVQPDTPMLIGSLSKAITAAVTRELVAERMAERGVTLPPCEGEYCACEEPPCPATAADVPIVHPELDLLPPHILDVMRGDAPLPVPLNDGVPCVKGADPAYADPRWAKVTLGNLISHQAGLARDPPYWSDLEGGALAYMPALRGYEPGDEEAWAREHEHVRAREPEYAEAFDKAREYLTELHGGAPVYFVGTHNTLEGHSPFDETLLLAMGRCHDFDPGPSNYYEDGNGLYEPIDNEGSYSNYAIDIVGRIAEHLQRERNGRGLAADNGDLESHNGSAVAEYLAEQLGVEGGVESSEGIFNWQRTSEFHVPAIQPTPRVYSGVWAYPLFPSFHRPYCVMQGDACTLEPWAVGWVNDALVRAPYDLEINEDRSRGFVGVPRWRQYHTVSVAAGAYAAEGPLYLRFARDHQISGDSDQVDNDNGVLGRDWTRFDGHGGALAGGRANILQLAPETMSLELPPFVDGHMVDDFHNTEERVVTLPAGVDVYVAINQNHDPRCQRDVAEDGSWCKFEYRFLSRMLLFELAQVDWDAVAAEVDAEPETLVGMAVDRRGHAHYWYADDIHVSSREGPASYGGRVDRIDEKAPGPQPHEYDLPSTRIGTDVLGVAMDSGDTVFAWYTDGRVSAGLPRALAAHEEPTRFELGSGLDPFAIIDLAIDGEGRVHAWFEDGSRTVGTATWLDAEGAGRFAVADGYTPDDVVAVAIERGAGPDGVDRVWARYRDGHVSRGTVDDLASLE